MIGKTNAQTVTGGGGGSMPAYTRPIDWLTIPTLDTTKDEIYILNGVIKDGINMVFFNIKGTGTIDWGDGNTENFSGQNTVTCYHHFEYDNVSSTTWTDHNNARQVLIKISGNRGEITLFSTAVQNSYTNADGVTVNYSSNTSNNMYEIKADVNSCSVTCSTTAYNYLKNLEIFDWKGTLTYLGGFYSCNNLQNIPQLDTSNVVDMTNMFYSCSSLQTIPQLDTSKVTNMSSMFINCISLITIPQLDTNKVVSMANMFNNCTSLQTIPLLDTSNVTTMAGMFTNCISLQNIPQLDTNKVTSMSSMFSSCGSLQTIPLLDTGNVTNMSSMFSSCSSLQTIPLLDTKKVTNMRQMFYNCYNLQNIPQLNTSIVTNMNNMFYYCYALQTIPLLNMSSVTNIGNMFYYCYALQVVKFYNVNPVYTSAITVGNLSNSTMITKQALVDLFNSLPSSPAGARTIQLGSILQGYLANCYVKDSGDYYTAIIQTNDTTIVSGKTYYTYNWNTDTYTQVTPDFTTDIQYYELVTATWNKYVICESTDTGATLALTWIANKGYTIS